MSDPTSPGTPANKSVDPPPVNQETINNSNAIGFANRYHSTQLVTGGGGSPFCYGSTSGDMYLAAGNNCQMNALDQQHRVDTENKQFYKEVDRKVVGKQTVLIGGNNTIAVDGNQTVNVVGHHVLNVGGTQTTTSFGGQSVTVKDKGRKLSVDAGGYKMTVQGDYSYTRNENDKKEIVGGWMTTNCSIDLSTVLGDFITVKASNEMSITASEKVVIGSANEASATFGPARKLNLAGSFEQTFGFKRVYKTAVGDDKFIGPHKIHDVSYDHTAKLEQLEAKMVREMFMHKKLKTILAKKSGQQIL